MRKKIGIIGTPGATEAVAAMLQVPCNAMCAHVSDYRQIEHAFAEFEKAGAEKIVVDDGVIGASNDAIEALRTAAAKAQGRVVFVTARAMDDPLLFQLATEAAADIFIPGIQVDAPAVFTRYIEQGSDPTERSAWILLDPSDPRLATKRKTLNRFQRRKLGEVPTLSIKERPCGSKPKLLEGSAWAEPEDAPAGPLTNEDICVPDDDDTEAGIEALLAEATPEDAEWLGNLADEMDPDGTIRAEAAASARVEEAPASESNDDWMKELEEAGEQTGIEEDADPAFSEPSDAEIEEVFAELAQIEEAGDLDKQGYGAEDDEADWAEAEGSEGDAADIIWRDEIGGETEEDSSYVEAMEVQEAEEAAETDAGWDDDSETYQNEAAESGEGIDADSEAEDMGNESMEKEVTAQGIADEPGVIEKSEVNRIVEEAVARAIAERTSGDPEAPVPMAWDKDMAEEEDGDEIIPLADLLGRATPEDEKPGRGYVTAIMGSRRGIGCTYLAFTLACELAACGEKTALVLSSTEDYRYAARTLNATPGSNEYCFKVNGVDVFSWRNRKVIRPAAYDQIVYDLGLVDLDQTATDTPAGVFKRAKLPILLISAAPWDLHIVNDYLGNFSPSMLRGWTWAVWGAGKRGKEPILRGLTSKGALGPSFDRLFTVPSRPDYFSTDFKPQLDMYRNLLAPVLPKELKPKEKDAAASAKKGTAKPVEQKAAEKPVEPGSASDAAAAVESEAAGE